MNDVSGQQIAQEVKVSLAFALAIATLAQSLGHISGAHLNPAVTLGLLVSCQISLLRCISYILAQMLGAVTASWIVKAYSNGKPLGVNKVRGQSCPFLDFNFTILLHFSFCVTKKFNPLHSYIKLQLHDNLKTGHGFVIEFLATLQLVLCVLAVTDNRRSDVKGSAPLAIGLSVGLGHFAAVSEHSALTS